MAQFEPIDCVTEVYLYTYMMGNMNDLDVVMKLADIRGRGGKTRSSWKPKLQDKADGKDIGPKGHIGVKHDTDVSGNVHCKCEPIQRPKVCLKYDIDTLYLEDDAWRVW